MSKASQTDNKDIKVTIECNAEQAGTLLTILDFSSRILMGQTWELDTYLTWNKKGIFTDQAKKEEVTKLIRETYFPELDSRGSYHGIFGEDCPELAKETWDIQQVLRYALAWYKHPEGGCTVDFGTPLAASKQPLCKATCSKV